METEFINLTQENISTEHLCCIIRSRKPHAGVEKKRQWLLQRINEGHVLRKLNAKATVFIEYAPLSQAWVPIMGENYLYIYCLWVLKDYKGKGYGKKLLEYCLHDALEKGMSGVCMLGSKTQKAWLSDQSFVKKYGFKVVDTTDYGYELLALSFDHQYPHFTQNAKNGTIDQQELTIYYDDQCPYIDQSMKKIKDHCDTNRIPLSLIHVETLKQAKELPCVFNNYAVFYQGQFQTVNLLDVSSVKRILKRG